MSISPQTTLPDRFVQRMTGLLGDEATAFFASFERAVAPGLRVNTLKLQPDRFYGLVTYPLAPVPWCPAGFTVDDPVVRPGRSPLHQAGLYYLQEPSAMAVAEILAPQPGERVLDLSASPGGKATQIASLMQGRGLLVANDPVPGRIKPLGENLERWGARNVVLTNAGAGALAGSVQGAFDRVLVDAPCSGEGMFQKTPAALEAWSEETVAGCALRQRHLLEEAARLVRPGGVLLYSTCTFAPEENEVRIAHFMAGNPGWELVDIPKENGFAPGCPDWVPGGGPAELERMARLWPHRLDGTGHTIALLRRVDGPASASKRNDGLKKRSGRRSPHRDDSLERAVSHWRQFCAEAGVHLSDSGSFSFDGERLFLEPEGHLDLSGVRVVRSGLWLGSVKPGRFEPSHALALALSADDIANHLDLSVEEAPRYLAGEPLQASGPAGWVLITVEGWPIGWGRRTGKTVKNRYPKGLRRM
jgi:NOL1/NOP2/sun family putative RNA methylase